MKAVLNELGHRFLDGILDFDWHTSLPHRAGDLRPNHDEDHAKEKNNRASARNGKDYHHGVDSTGLDIFLSSVLRLSTSSRSFLEGLKRLPLDQVIEGLCVAATLIAPVARPAATELFTYAPISRNRQFGT